MIILLVKVKALPEKSVEFCQTVVSLSDVFKKEKGCLYYNAYSDVEDKNSFFLFLACNSKAGLMHHLESRPFNVLVGAVQNLCMDGQVDVDVLNTTSSRIVAIQKMAVELFAQPQ